MTSQLQVNSAVVTGGSGFVGSHIVDSLLERGVEVYVVDNFSTGSKDNLAHHKDNAKLRILVGDVGDIADSLPALDNIDVVFHEAAIASVPMSVSSPMLVHDVNVNMTMKLLEFCRKREVRKIVFASSAAVYGLDSDLQAHEQILCKPTTPYAASKLTIENYLHAYFRSYGLESVSLRYFNVYGPRQSLTNGYSGVITAFASQLVRSEAPTIFGDGLQVRDFVHVKDVARANILAMESPNVTCDVFNVASGRAVSILELLLMLKDITNTTGIEHGFAPARAGDGRFGQASIDKIKLALNYNPEVTLEAGLKEVVDYIRNLGVNVAIEPLSKEPQLSAATAVESITPLISATTNPLGPEGQKS